MQAKENGRGARHGATPALSLGKYRIGVLLLGQREPSQDLRRSSCLPTHIAVTASKTHQENRKLEHEREVF